MLVIPLGILRFGVGQMAWTVKKLHEITLNGATILRPERLRFWRELSPQATLISRTYRLRKTGTNRYVYDPVHPSTRAT
jgi:hypothetical protein